MPYADPIDPATPADNTVVGLGDDRIRELKRALIARLQTIFQNIDNNPLQFIAGIIPTAAIADKAVQYAKIQDVGVDRILGRASAGVGIVEEISCTAAARALLDDVDVAAQRATLGLGDLALLDTIAAAQIDALAVGTAALADGAVTAVKIPDDEIPDTKLTPALRASISESMAARARNAVGQVLADGVMSLVTYDTEVLDTNNFYNPAVPDRLTIPAGFVKRAMLTASFFFDATGTAPLADVEVLIEKNGVAANRVAAIHGRLSEFNLIAVDPTPVAGDYYKLYVRQLTGAGHNLLSTAFGGFSIAQF